MRSPMLADLAELDPARELHAPGSAEDDALAQILAQSRVAPAGERRPGARRPGRAAAVASAAAAVAVAVVVTTVTLDSPAAYASWTPVPAALPAAEQELRAEQCGTGAAEIVEGPDGPVVQESPVEPVLTDVRGDYTYVVLAGDGAYSECFVTSTDGEPPMVVTSSAAGVDLPAPDARELTTLQSGTASWSEGDGTEGALTSAFGQVGEDVTAVELTLTTGEAVEASVTDGWWAVWAPGGSALATSAEVTYADGTTAQVVVG
ncbi:hypothetical protein BCE75_101240 [Isoptericola sp. CG 20/1183]|uniref:Uncharacterized protein n=1 Tax=Isoptericola halotolerans TaxID=300560 RepID=A0ABX5EH37_9MICO|nr:MULTISPECIES: hypothetical protein [Isoptericola]MCK0118444.1 hypothetical protein [Isoptericola sp. S6320L]PRZ08640.1 hypothetical protein BCL65_102182 [Isoptericola halotolerans]PRZ10913.1 hypothetical protein BCE75_101240 [Isoptericola sp. CG 20/1183]